MALEYSKLFDVIMNQAPNYVVVAWGTMKVLLTANVEDAKLKENVRNSLVAIGNQLWIVNQLLSLSPTDKMVEAVASLYASFTRLLRKALRSYRKAKVLRVLQSFTFPWDRKFRPLVDEIGQQFTRIQNVSNVSHVRTSHNILQCILECHEDKEDMAPSKPDAAQLHVKAKEQLRMEVKNEMRVEMQQQISDMFEAFDKTWLQKFEGFMIRQNSSGHASVENQSPTSLIPADLTSASGAETVFLSTHAANPHDLAKFRDAVFPLLESIEVCRE